MLTKWPGSLITPLICVAVTIAVLVLTLSTSLGGYGAGEFCRRASGATSALRSCISLTAQSSVAPCTRRCLFADNIFAYHPTFMTIAFLLLMPLAMLSYVADIGDKVRCASMNCRIDGVKPANGGLSVRRAALSNPVRCLCITFAAGQLRLP